MLEVKKFYLILHPRPAYLIGSGRVGEKVNFMAASWVTPIAEEPPLVGVAVGVDSYTRELIDFYREFTVNVLPMEKLNSIYYAGTRSGRDEDKTKIVKPVKGEKVQAPAVEDAIGVLECRLYSSVEAQDAIFYVGEVLTARADERVFDERRGWDTARVDIPLHNWGRGFYGLGRFQMAKS
ncbi:MAG: flavin reductase family protein [Thermofilaceae archaeon]|nr:flavin reductase family protein [Thermofilaceae archaeon]MDW8003995.1 flavin reductase family protein [Thermofilaceae archaeon]